MFFEKMERQDQALEAARRQSEQRVDPSLNTEDIAPDVNDTTHIDLSKLVSALDIAKALGYDPNTPAPPLPGIEQPLPVLNNNANAKIPEYQALWILALRDLQRSLANLTGDVDGNDY